MTERLSERVLALPTGLQLDDAAVSRIVSLVQTAIENASMVRCA